MRQKEMIKHEMYEQNIQRKHMCMHVRVRVRVCVRACPCVRVYVCVCPCDHCYLWVCVVFPGRRS